MMKVRTFLKISIPNTAMVLVLLLTILSLLSACGSTATPANNGTVTTVSFKQDVAPIFNQRCTSCHSGELASGGLDLSSYTGVMAGGGNGTVITAGDAGNSRLISLVSSGQMPRSGAKLTPDQIAILENWVNSGAKDN